MSDVVLKVENLSKTYRLGEVGTGTISHDLNRWWAKIRGKEDPYSQVGQINDRTQKATSDYVDVLKDINFEVRQGEILGIIGKNGAGKSTLLKLISRITAPTSGSIKAKGRIASLLEVGTGMNPEMTARENIYLNGTILGMTKQEISSKFDEIIDFSGCAMFVDTPVKRFSSGMRVRLGFAVAAFLEPEILIVDEVLAVGDAEFQKKAIGKMKEVSQGGGRTVLFVSHNMASIQHLCTKILVLNEGGISFYGDVSEGIDHYLSLGVNNSDIQIGDRKDRTGGSLFRFTDVRLLNENKEEVLSFYSGMDVIFELGFDIKEALDNVVCRMEIINSKGVTVCVLNNYHCDYPFTRISEKGHVYCSISKLPLNQGTYHVVLSCLKDLEVIDHIESAFKFSVEEGDFFETGKIIAMTDGVLVNNKWKYENI